MPDIESLREAAYARKDPQFENPEAAYQESCRQCYEELESLHDDERYQMDSFHRIVKDHMLYKGGTVNHIFDCYDSLLDALDDLKGEIAGEISDF